MKGAFVFLVLVSIGSGIKYDGLIVKFGMTKLQAGKEFFFNVPRTIIEAEAAGYHLNVRPNGPLMELKMYCAPRRIVCPLYHITGFVAGMQIGIPVDSFNPALKPERYFVKWHAPAADGEPAGDYWTATQYYVTEESLKIAPPIAADGSTLQSDGVWINDLDGELMKVALTEADLASKTNFKKQSCFMNMGTHYYYNMTKQLTCDKFILPWFAMVTAGDMLGVGFQTFGKAPMVLKKDQDWFEQIPQKRAVPLKTIPDAPECYLDTFMEYGGLVSIHIYYISEPWSIRCKPSDSAAPTPTIAAPVRVSNGQPHPRNNLRISTIAALLQFLLW